jgi:hypothetical protein
LASNLANELAGHPADPSERLNPKWGPDAQRLRDTCLVGGYEMARLG